MFRLVWHDRTRSPRFWAHLLRKLTGKSEAACAKGVELVAQDAEACSVRQGKIRVLSETVRIFYLCKSHERHGATAVKIDKCSFSPSQLTYPKNHRIR